MHGDRYLEEVGRGLSFGHYANNEILAELRQHIEDSTESMERTASTGDRPSR